MGTKPISLAQLLDKQLAQGQAGGNTLLLPANVAGLTGLTVAKLARVRRRTLVTMASLRALLDD